MRQLLDQDANVNATATMRTEDTDLTGSTPLHAATLTPDVAVARLFLDRGANIEVVTSLGHTPLHLTAVFENEKVAVLLMQREPTFRQ